MALVLPGLGFLLLLVVCIGIGFLLARRGARGSTLVERTAAQHLTRGRWAALVAGLGAFALALACDDLGRGFVLAPAVGGAFATGILALAERTVPTEDASLRTVRLDRRSPLPWVSPATWVAGATNVALLAAVIVTGWSTATSDDQGRSGRAVEWVTVDGSQSGSPWPGSFYSWPTLVALVVATLAFVAGLRLVTTRPQVNADALTELTDADLRRRSARLLQAVYLIVLGLTLGALSLMLVTRTSSVASGAPTWVSVAHWLGLAGVLVGAGTVVTGVVTGVKR